MAPPLVHPLFPARPPPAEGFPRLSFSTFPFSASAGKIPILSCCCRLLLKMQLLCILTRHGFCIAQSRSHLFLLQARQTALPGRPSSGQPWGHICVPLAHVSFGAADAERLIRFVVYSTRLTYQTRSWKLPDGLDVLFTNWLKSPLSSPLPNPLAQSY